MPLPTYYAILTNTGIAKLAAATASGIPVPFAFVAVGDGNGAPITPDPTMVALVHERARVPTNNVQVSSDEPDIVRVEGLIPGATGGFTIREAGLFDFAGDLLAIASYPPIYKPQPSDGVIVEEYIRILIQYATVAAIALTVDPDVITATRTYVDDATAGGLALWEAYS